MKKLLIIFLILLYTNIYAKDLKIAFLATTPPYTLTDGSGITIAIVKEALKYKGHTCTPEFMNISRSIEMYKNGFVDANSILQDNMKLKGYQSDYFMQYDNVVFTLQSSNIKISTISDLEKYDFTAFQQANTFFGKEFKEATLKAGNKYHEIDDQKQQVLLFLKSRTQAVIMDRYVYKYYKNLLIEENRVNKDIKENIIELFTPTKLKVIFSDPKIRDDFNEGLQHLKSSGRYQEIYEHYSKKFF